MISSAVGTTANAALSCKLDSAYDASDQRQVSGLGLGLWCLSPLSTIFQLHPGSLISGGNPEYPEKPPNLPQLTDNLKFYRDHLDFAGLLPGHGFIGGMTTRCCGVHGEENGADLGAGLLLAGCNRKIMAKLPQKLSYVYY
jgi:hypothetical protein